MRLFKYSKIDKYAIENLIKKQFYFNKLQLVNDPFECTIDIEGTEEQLSFLLEAQAKYLKGKTLVYKKEDELKTKLINSLRIRATHEMGVSSFTTDWKSNLMWGHYADSYKGICLCFDIEERHDLIKVNYFNEPNKLVFKSGRIEPEFENGDLFGMYSNKHPMWQYENEWRLIGKPGKVHEYGDNVLRKIYFGVNTPDQDIDTIMKLLKGEEIEFFKMNISREKYEIEFLPIW